MAIVVTGATGNVGRPLVDELVRAGAAVRAVSRHPATAGLPGGVAVSESVLSALPGADALFLNSRALGSELAGCGCPGAGRRRVESRCAVRDQRRR